MESDLIARGRLCSRRILQTNAQLQNPLLVAGGDECFGDRKGSTRLILMELASACTLVNDQTRAKLASLMAEETLFSLCYLRQMCDRKDPVFVAMMMRYWRLIGKIRSDQRMRYRQTADY